MSEKMVQMIFFAMDLILMYDSLLDDECRVRSKAIFTSSVPPLKPKRPLCF